MKKYLIFGLILCFGILFGCNLDNEETKLDENVGLSGNLVEDNKVQDPIYEEIDLKPLDKLEIINIDDVVQNCRYEEGKLGYIDASGIGVYFNSLFATKQGFLILGDGLLSYEDADENNFWVSASGERAYNPLEKYDDFLDFLKRWEISEKGIFDTVYNNHYINYPGFYHGDELCEQLEGPERGETENHYFLYGSRKDVELLQQYLLIDDNLYFIGKDLYICEDYDEKWCDNYDVDLIREGIWRVTDFSDDKIIVKKFTQGQLNEPYKSNLELLLGLDSWTEIGTFKIKTCEIDL